MFQYSGEAFVRLIHAGRAVSADANAKAKIKLNIPQMSAEDVAGILLCESSDPGVLFHFDDASSKREEGKPRFPGISAIKCNNAWENMHSVKIGSLKKKTVLQLKVTEVKPVEGGMFDVTLWVIIEQPADNYLEVLAERCNREQPITLVQTVEDPPIQEDIEDVIAKAKGSESPEKQEDAFPVKPKRRKAKSASGKRGKAQRARGKAAAEEAAGNTIN